MLRRRVVRVPLSSLQQRVQRALSIRTPVEVDDASLRAAAVSLVVGSDPDAVLLIRRATRPGDPWSGQMGLPGGHRDTGDPDLLATAIRETFEEVGLQLTPDMCLGALDDIAPRTRVLPPIFVRPFVFALPGRPGLTAGDEVAELVWASMDHLEDPAIYRGVTLRIQGEDRTFPAYHVGENVVWGMTERIITGFLGSLV